MDLTAIVSEINSLDLTTAFAAILGVTVAVWGFRRVQSLLGR